MDISALSRKHLEDAIELGYITVDGREMHLTASQILTVARYIVEKGLLASTVEAEENAPSEMFSQTKPVHDFEESLSILESDY